MRPRVCECGYTGAGVACARVALLVPYATCWCRILCGFSGSTTFFDILINDTIFEKRKIMEREMCVLIFSTTSI